MILMNLEVVACDDTTQYPLIINLILDIHYCEINAPTPFEIYGNNELIYLKQHHPKISDSAIAHKNEDSMECV